MIDVVCTYVEEDTYPTRLRVVLDHEGERYGGDYLIHKEEDEALAVADACLFVKDTLGEEPHVTGIGEPRNLELLVYTLQKQKVRSTWGSRARG